MALSKEDKDFYEGKLALNSFGYVFAATTIIGAVGWPVLFYMQDASAGLTARWNFDIAFKWAMMGFMVGTMVSICIYLGFKFLLQMEWLPPRK
jgi:hypothetical protein